MILSYCPNCRRPLDENPLAWICWRTYSHDRTNTLVVSDQARKEVLHAEFGRGVVGSEAITHGTTGHRGLRREDILCQQYNLPEADCCASSRCGGMRAPSFSRPACPYEDCAEELPLMGDVPGQSITVTGVSGAGKSHYVVALDHWWKKQLPPLGFTALPAMGKRSMDNFELHRRAVKTLEIVNATTPGEMISYSWHIRPAEGRGPGILVSLPDVSGERLMDETALAANRHFDYSSGIILLLDGDRLAAGLYPQHATARNPDDHITLVFAMLNYLNHRMSSESRANLPMAVCVNKVDILKGYDVRWQQMITQNKPDHRERFDFDAIEARSKAVETLLKESDETVGLAYTLQDSFRNCMFFPVATIGSDTRPITFTPQGVGDPFLWMLWHMDLLP